MQYNILCNIYDMLVVKDLAVVGWKKYMMIIL